MRSKCKLSLQEIAGMVTRKHVYEIAKLKSEDNYLQMFDLQVICKEIIDEAFNIGIKVDIIIYNNLSIS
jgi:large subunit ribosomal protein L11